VSKTLKTFAIALLVIAPSMSFANAQRKSLEFDCGRYLNVVRWISVQPAPSNSWKPYLAQITVDGRDPKTGVLTGLDFQMSGALSSDPTEIGNLGRAYVFVDETRPQFQLVLQVPNNTGTSKAIFMEIVSKDGKSKNKRMVCKLQR